MRDHLLTTALVFYPLHVRLFWEVKKKGVVDFYLISFVVQTVDRHQVTGRKYETEICIWSTIPWQRRTEGSLTCCRQ